MRKFVLVVASLLSCSATVQASFWPEATASSLEIGVGYRQDRLKFTNKNDGYGYSDSYSDSSAVAPLPFNPEFKREFKNINIWQIEARGKYVTCDNVYLRGSADYGWVTSGKDHRKIEFGSGSGSSGAELDLYDSSSKIKGNVYDVKLAVGYQFLLCDDTFSIAPLVGYSWHGQHYRNGHHNHSGYYSDYSYSYSDYSYSGSSYSSSSDSSYSDYSYSDYSYGSNRGKYHTRWNGPFIGFDFDYSLCCEWDIFGGYEFHWARFHAKGEDNLGYGFGSGSGSGFATFHQRSKSATGQVVDFGVRWAMCDCWTVALRGEFQWWKANHGHTSRKLTQASLGDIKTKCFLETPTRHTEWCSGSIMLDVGMVF